MPQQFPVKHRTTLPRARRAVLLAVCGLALSAPGALADAGGAEAGKAAPAPQSAPAAATPLSRATIRSAQRRLHLRPDGHLGPRSCAAIRRFQKRHGLRVDGRLQPATLAALRVVPATGASRAAAPSGDAARILAAIAQCESGGDPTRVSKDGKYRGKYQFAQSTWEAAGGTGDPAAAPEAEQDQRAAALYAAEGIKPWPVCGKQATAGK